MTFFSYFFLFPIVLLSFLGQPFSSSPLKGGNAYASPSEDEDHIRLTIHLLGYLSQDYPEAVSQGAIKNQFEFAEQKEFALTTLETASKSERLRNHPSLLKHLSQLKTMIDQHVHEREVVALSRQLKELTLSLANFSTYPSQNPSLSHGKQLFQQHCISCHGQEGRGDGPAGKGLEPAPANFWNHERMMTLSPFSTFNTIKLGVPGTGMASFSHLEDKELWNLAFYIHSLRWTKPKNTSSVNSKELLALSNAPTLKDLAMKSDDDLTVWIKEYLKIKEKHSQDRQQDYLVLLRTNYTPPPSPPSSPNSGPSSQSSSPSLSSLKKNQNQLAITIKMLQESKQAYHENQMDLSQRKALESYLMGFEALEPILQLRAAHLVPKAEQIFIELREALRKTNSKENPQQAKKIETLYQQSFSVLEQVTPYLLEEKKSSSYEAFFFSLSIFLREGLEALLIILTLLSVTRATQKPEAISSVHGGWISALLAGISLWFLSQSLMPLSGMTRELIESFCSLFAVVVLLYVGVWLHSKTETQKWQDYIFSRTHQALSQRQRWTLFSIAFLAVFREAFETVLFFQVAWLQYPHESTSLLAGIGISLVLILFLSWIHKHFGRLIPLRWIFKSSSFLMLFFAVVLTGKGLRSLQESGYLSMTPIEMIPSWQTIGIYPTEETLLGQILILMFSLALILLGTKIKKMQL